MIQPVQSSSIAPSTPFQPSTVNPLYKDHFGISTLTQAVVSRKSFIVLGFLALATVLIIFFKKLFSTESIDAWVKRNYKDLDASHQGLLAKVIAMAKKEMDSKVNPSVRAVASVYKIGNSCSCDVCENIKIYILQYFKANQPKPNEIDAWVEQNCDHLTEGDLFRVASVIQLASTKMQSMVKPDVEEVVYTFFASIMGVYRSEEDWKVIKCVLRYFRDKNQEIQTWLLSSKYKDTPEEVIAQVVQRVNEIEKLPDYSQNPEGHIRTLRLNTFVNHDPIQPIALSYLTYARVQADIKSKI